MDVSCRQDRTLGNESVRVLFPLPSRLTRLGTPETEGDSFGMFFFFVFLSLSLWQKKKGVGRKCSRKKCGTLRKLEVFFKSGYS